MSNDILLKKGLSTVEKPEVENGSVLFETDSGRMYIDDNDERTQIGRKIDHGNTLPAGGVDGDVFLLTGENNEDAYGEIYRTVNEHVNNVENPHSVTTAQLGVMDYIVAQGVSGDWTYRKWNSGVYECWGEIGSYFAGVHSNLVGAGTYFGHGSVSFPVTFTGSPVVTYSMHCNSGYEYAGKAIINTNSFTWYALSNAPYEVGMVAYISVHVIGKV